MNRGDVKLMIDQLVCLDLSEADAEIAEFVIAKLEHFGNEYGALSQENAKLQKYVAQWEASYEECVKGQLLALKKLDELKAQIEWPK